MATRLLGSLAMVAALTVTLGVGRAAACSWAPIELDAVVDEAHYIFIGQVVENPAERTYIVAVDLPFRGQVPGTVRFAPEKGAPVSSCDAGLEVGATYLFGPRALTGHLGIGDVWLTLDGTQLETYFVQVPDMDYDGLIAYLDGLPDTALAQPYRPAPATTSVGLLLIGLAAALILLHHRRERAIP